ncbi:hypothetical protein AVEN_156703-1 [Araneus ventricosus]|uniref:Uncharacterized protein n=1 Tax=Araneus ventricosus TaxID=182803 RepID=A0A4Y2R3V1_ARAVE|nr:hypothetical protein AVEN_253281-1 [Araneus ventricosus]GBN70079.1 hypothetical protein AVEN_156703-1 [Araneus ventricosus]
MTRTTPDVAPSFSNAPHQRRTIIPLRISLTLHQVHILSYRHEKNPRHQTCLWRSLWKRDIPLHFGGEGKGDISFGVDRAGGSLISLCTLFENEFLAYRKCACVVKCCC